MRFGERHVQPLATATSALGQPASRAHCSKASAPPQIAAATHAFSRFGLATWWALEFDNISLRVCDIDRGSFALGAITGSS